MQRRNESCDHLSGQDDSTHFTWRSHVDDSPCAILNCMLPILRINQCFLMLSHRQPAAHAQWAFCGSKRKSLVSWSCLRSAELVFRDLRYRRFPLAAARADTLSYVVCLTGTSLIIVTLLTSGRKMTQTAETALEKDLSSSVN